MLGLQTENKLAQLLKSIADGEKEIEVTRQVLAEQADFEPFTAFKRIDRDENSALTVYEVLDFLRDNQISCLEKDAHNLFKVYDTNQDGRITYSEFLNLVLPKNSPSLRSLATTRQSYFVSKYETLPYDAEWALARVIEKEINYIRRIENLKEDLALRYDWSSLEAFKLVDEERAGTIDLDSVYLFLKRNHIIINESDILCLLRRCDSDGDSKLSYSEFLNAVSPGSSIKASSVRNSPIRERRSVSPTKHYSPSKQLSPTRSPSRGRLQESTIYNSGSKKPSNVEYYQYLSNSNKKSRLSASPVRQSTYSNKKLHESTYEPRLSPSKNIISGYKTPSKSRSGSPVKEYKSPIKEAEENQVAKALKEQIDLEHDMENLKNSLALRSDFNLLDAFRFFDKDSRGYITKNELKDGLNCFDIYPTSDECYLVVRKFDADNDGILRFNEFANIFTPKNAEYHAILRDRTPSYLSNSQLNLIFGYETRHLIKNVLDQTVNNELRHEQLRQKLNNRPLFNIYDAFKAIDKNNNGYIDISEFREALVEQGLYASTEEISNLVKRYDHNEDGKVSYYDFVQELTPKSPRKY